MSRNSRPAAVAQSGPVRLPVTVARKSTTPVLPRRGDHRVSVGDALTIMRWERNTYDKVTVTQIAGDMVRVTEEQGEVRTMPLTALYFLAGQAAAHHGRGPETPGVGVIFCADGTSHGITDAGLCVVCVHNH